MIRRTIILVRRSVFRARRIVNYPARRLWEVGLKAGREESAFRVAGTSWNHATRDV
jgi:hypothetical protein